MTVLWIFAALALSSWPAAADVMYVAVTPDGTRIGPTIAGGDRLVLPLGSTVELYLREDCQCTGHLESLKVDGQDVSGVGRPLPATLRSGKGWEIPSEAGVLARWGVEKGGSRTGGGELAIDFTRHGRWWSVGDTVAYAVTRQAGNTAVAGAGVFVDFPFVDRLRGVLQYSFAVHLLPPGDEGGPADLGISPLSVGLFGNRLVMGIGWNISRRGTRPRDHDRYVFIGFSASKLLNPQ